MNLVKDFYKYIDKVNIDRADIYEEKGDDFTIISFGEQGEEDKVYNIALVFYDNNDAVEIYIRKPIRIVDELITYKRINTLNAEYCGMSFFCQQNMITIKSYCKTGGKMEIALAQMIQNMKVAKAEFPDF